jgi:hypothetical protein
MCRVGNVLLSLVVDVRSKFAVTRVGVLLEKYCVKKRSLARRVPSVRRRWPAAGSVFQFSRLHLRSPVPWVHGRAAWWTQSVLQP